ncbi:MAG: hypothetical protein DMF72_13260 [Acidobacteria bacterium]|nr:MAG: hypothetical protein DMF72_13260 [Acidobacteriota bacterium]
MIRVMLAILQQYSARSARRHKAWGVSPRIAVEIVSQAREAGGSGITIGAYVICESRFRSLREL